MSERPADRSYEPENDPLDEDDGAPSRLGRRSETMPAARHRGRTLALQALYEADAAGHDPAATVARLIESEDAGSEAAAFARSLIDGVKASRSQIDEHIRGSAPQWPIDQLSAVDRNILRIAIYEMLIENETPVRVAVNEAVELAKAYGSDASSRFVNGVLGALSGLRNERNE